jgi:hypothetical protein
VLQAIERKTFIPIDGKLPKAFMPVFGHKARVIALIEDQDAVSAGEENSVTTLMSLSGKIESLKAISDPVAWQREQRSEW